MTALFTQSKPVIGVIHVGALPGTPRSTQTVAELIAAARREATLYRDGGVNAVMIENMHDVPYLRGEVGPEIVAAMTAIGSEVKIASGLPVGIQILAGANIEAMAVATLRIWISYALKLTRMHMWLMKVSFNRQPRSCCGIGE